jgi:Fe-Mn family superoxide dismutase
MHFKLPSLPFSPDALAPHISAETLEYHHGKHHAKYVQTLNDLIEGSAYEKMPLAEIIKKSEGPLYNNAAQTFNHDFYWKCLTPDTTHPSAELKAEIEKSFGSLEAFVAEFSKQAAGLFGSGWTWLVINSAGKLEIKNATNADNPVKWGDNPLLTCDAWEHAYYIDYRNARPGYIEGFWKVVNWHFVSENYRYKCPVNPEC